MTMGVSGFKTKKELKAAVGQPFGPHVVETSFFGAEYKPDGRSTVVGPCAHTNRKWFATVHCTGGVINKVE